MRKRLLVLGIGMMVLIGGTGWLIVWLVRGWPGNVCESFGHRRDPRDCYQDIRYGLSLDQVRAVLCVPPTDDGLNSGADLGMIKCEVPELVPDPDGARWANADHRSWLLGEHVILCGFDGTGALVYKQFGEVISPPKRSPGVLAIFDDF
jgi:hypothetical protein